MTRVLVVDAANVVGSRPDGWWKDRAGAARRLHEQLLVADTSYDEIVLVLEGAAKGGVGTGRDGHVQTVHAPRDGDATIVEQARLAGERGSEVTVVTADRFLRARVEGVGARAMGPSWLLDQLGLTIVPGMNALRFRGPVLPDGEPRDVYVVDGLVTYEQVASAEHVADGWIVPGLVDAHCHVGLDQQGAVDEETQEEQAVTDRDAGALLLRDCGSAADTAWIQDRDDLPRLIRAGRHLARTKRYLRDFAHEVEPPELASYVAREAQRGDGWVKLVGDWIERDAGDLLPSFPAETFAEAIRVAHDHGAKVTAHCFGEAVLPGLIESGIDCIEHGTGLSTDLIDAMVERGTALVPTVMQLDMFPQYADAAGQKFPAYAAHMRDLHARRRETIMAAHEAGVPIYAGTDAGGVLPHGDIAGEVLGLADYGFTAETALGAASWRAREWLGWNPTLEEGAPADFVVYDRDPLADLSVLRSPSRIVLRGRVVA